HRGNRVTAGRGNAFLQDTHLVSQVWLVTHGGRHTTQQGRDFHTGLGEAENVVNEQQHVLLLHVAEVLGHGQAGQCNAQTGAWWLIHLAEDQGGVFENVCFVHLDPEVITFTSTLTNAGEDRGTTKVASNTGNHFLNQNGLTNTGTTEQTNLSTLNVWGEQVDDLDSGLHHLGGGFKISKVWWLAVDWPTFLNIELRNVNVEGVAQGVEDVALDDIANGYGDWSASVDNFLTADETIGGLHSDRTDHVLAQVLSGFEGNRGGFAVQGQLNG